MRSQQPCALWRPSCAWTWSGWVHWTQQSDYPSTDTPATCLQNQKKHVIFCFLTSFDVITLHSVSARLSWSQSTKLLNIKTNQTEMLMGWVIICMWQTVSLAINAPTNTRCQTHCIIPASYHCSSNVSWCLANGYRNKHQYHIIHWAKVKDFFLPYSIFLSNTNIQKVNHVKREQKSACCHQIWLWRY